MPPRNQKTSRNSRSASRSTPKSKPRTSRSTRGTSSYRRGDDRYTSTRQYAPEPRRRRRTSILSRLRAMVRKMGQPQASRQPSRPPARQTSRQPARQTSRAPARPPATRQPAARQRTALPANPPMSLDRKLDLAGIVMLFVALAVLLILFSNHNSNLSEGVLKLLWQLFGWGTYLFPIALGIIGLWLVLRNFERIPQIGVERLLGMALLFTNLLTWLHFFSFPEDAYALARLMEGGGYIGGFFFKLLYDYLGWGGAAVGLLAWLLIALTLVLDVSVIDLFRWLPPLIVHIQDRAQDFLDDRRNGHTAPPAATRAAALPAAPPAFEPSAATAAAPAVPAGSMAAHRPWALPPLDQILDPGSEVTYDDELDRKRARLIEETLASFGAPVNVVEINRGPTITQFGVEPDFIESRGTRTRVRVGKIAALADDLALALAARAIRVEAPVPGKGYVGIEVPNHETALVALRDVIESEAFRRLKSSLRFVLGQDVAGNAFAADLAAMPHLLIAGATGSGKSVCVNALICCLLLHNTPDDLRLLMVDPKRVELTGYNGIPHLMTPVVVDLERVVSALQWVLREMDMRYSKLAEVGARNIVEYNARIEERNGRKLPRLVVLVDELADLMMLSPDETERSITRLAQLARATGIHLVLATQRPSVDVVTGLIKANFPARIAFAVASGVDSRVILDQPGAERLLGRGDMLFQSPDAGAPIRLQGAFVSDTEIQSLVSYWQSFGGPALAPSAAGGIPDGPPAGVPLKQMPFWEDVPPMEEVDNLLEESVDLARRQGRASISMLQRRLRIGYTRAARLIETMQEKGIIGTEPGPMGFEILDYGPTAPPVDE